MYHNYRLQSLEEFNMFKVEIEYFDALIYKIMYFISIRLFFNSFLQ